jgi:hypothetical protein
MFARRILPEDIPGISGAPGYPSLSHSFLRRIRESQIAKHAREAHKFPSLDKEMWMKIHKAEKLLLLFLFLVSGTSLFPDLFELVHGEIHPKHLE